MQRETHGAHDRDVGTKEDELDAAKRRVALAAEVRAREKDGWALVHRSGSELILVHKVRSPWWLLLIELVLVFGYGEGSNVRRWLHIEALDNGDLIRYTLGDIPKGWPRKRKWEVPDGRVGKQP